MVDTIKDLARYVASAQEARLAEFVKAHPHPFLVRVGPDAQILENPWTEQFAFATDVGDGGAEEDDEDAAEPPERAAIVAPVRKRDSGLFPDRISVGRARNCDVVLRFPSVSKVHAQLLVDGPRWALIDLDSSNGTLINGVRVITRKRHPLQLGDRLQFGTIDVEFVDARVTYERLRTVRR